MYWLILVVLIIVFFSKKKNVENFDGKYGLVCSCKNKTINQCVQCYNCGFCLDNKGSAQCIPGDVHGPYDSKKKCLVWYHNDPYSRQLWKSNCMFEAPYVI